MEGGLRKAGRGWRIFVVFTALAPVLMAIGCAREDGPEVVVYVSLDELYSRPILDEFERRSGIRVRAQYDTEAAKTTGLVNRILAERGRPRADVFWNNEVAQTIALKNAGALEPYASPSRAAIPEAFKDPDAYWTGFAARARVIIYNTELVSEPPTSIRDLLSEEWSGSAAIANPLFGTTATHAAALFAVWGDDTARDYFAGLRSMRVAVLPGNATVRDLVARGEYALGLTDTDDANGGVLDGFPVAWVLPDQEAGGLGTLVLPNTVALVRGGPNSESGKRLIDYLLGPEVEAALAASRSIQIPLNPAVKAPENVPALAEIRTMDVDFDEISRRMPQTAAFIREEFLQ